MTSPKYYNFETDRVFAYMPETTFKHILANYKTETLKKRIEDKFTSYDGFWSHYSNDLDTWLEDEPIEDWDHNQLATLFEAFLLDHVDPDNLNTWYILEGPNGNGEIDSIIQDHISDEGYQMLNKAFGEERYTLSTTV